MKTCYFGRISAVLILSLLFMTVSALPGIKTETQSLAVSKYYKVQIKVGKKSFEAKLKKNKTTEQLVARMPFTVKMNELNGNEKYCYLDQTLPVNAKKPGTIRAGDLMLYGDDCVVLFYKTFQSSYSYTKIGHISNIRGLEDLLGNGNIKVLFKP